MRGEGVRVISIEPWKQIRQKHPSGEETVLTPTLRHVIKDCNLTLDCDSVTVVPQDQTSDGESSEISHQHRNDSLVGGEHLWEKLTP